MGILKSGESESEIFPELQIILPKVFEAVQKMKHQRSLAMHDKRSVPLHTKGNSLLSGNVFCGHCGARLTVTTNKKKYVRKDGSVTRSIRTRYVCYNKTRHKHKCNGQTGYTTTKLDRIVSDVVRSLFSRFTDIPKETLIEERFVKHISESQAAITQAKAVMQADMSIMAEYETEVLKIIRGESKLNAGLLNKLYEESKEKVSESSDRVRVLEKELMNCEHLRESLGAQFDEIRSWADIYDTCDIETKKMILSRLFSAVKVRSNYELEIDVTASCEKLGFYLNEAENREDDAELAKIAV